MPDMIQATLLSVGATTGTPTAKWSYTAENNGTFYAVDVRNTSSFSIFAKAGTGGTTLTFTVQATADPLGVDGWAAIGTREAGSGAYATSAIAVASTTSKSLYTDPTDNYCWVRLNVTTNDTTGPIVKLVSEV